MARYAMRNPWWTLSHFDATVKASALQGDAKQVHWQLSEAATAASTAQVTGFNYKEPKTEQEVGWSNGGGGGSGDHHGAWCGGGMSPWQWAGGQVR